jgi:hydrogenase expression/formation protein HypE
MTPSDLLDGMGRLAAEPRRAPRQAAFRDAHIEMAHGAGGKASRRLIEGLVAPLLSLPADALGDAAVIHFGDDTLAFTADGFVVRPLSFPGGSIGELAVNGTVNDLAVSGARPLGLLVTLIVEAGIATGVLEAEMRAVGEAAERAGVAIVGGITILLSRGDVDLDADLRSDTRSVWPLIEVLGDAAGAGVRWMRDPTRGGVATVLNELARDTRFTIAIDEASLPVRDEVRGACELLGLDPLHIANEGQFVAVVSPDVVERTLNALHAVPGGGLATIIGEVKIDSPGVVLAVSPYGSARVVDMLVGDPLPRIC